MRFNDAKMFHSHGDGTFTPGDFKQLGKQVVIESHVLVFHPEQIEIGDRVYVGHSTILKGYYKGILKIGSGTWIGQGCFLHAAGNITIGQAVGIGPFVKIITSQHGDGNMDIPIIEQELMFKPVQIGDGADIGVGSILLPGVIIGEGAVIGAGSVVTRDVPAFSVYAGVPAKFLRNRK